MGGHNVVATVFAECHSMYRKDGPEQERSLGETEFVRGQAAMSDGGQYGRARACQALFGNVDLTLGADVSVLIGNAYRYFWRAVPRSKIFHWLG